MKEIGAKLKEARESMGISLEEASEDLKVKKNQIENIENGDMDAFKDVFYLKYFIRDYSKYLGLNYEDMVDEFNEYLFDYTSKISIEDIKEAQNKEKKQDKSKKEDKIMSPYTVENRKKYLIPSFLIYCGIGVLTLLVVLILCIIFL